MELKSVKPASSYARPLPGNFEERDRLRFNDILVCNTNKAAIHQLNNITVYKYFLLKGFSLLAEFCLPVQKRQAYSFKHFFRAFLQKKRVVEEGIWITDLWSNNYFHWILECLPRLMVLRDASIEAPLIIPQKFLASSFIKESLEELKIDLLPYSFDETLKVNKLYVVDNDAPCAFDSNYINGLRQLYIDTGRANPVAKRLIYISRKKATRRRILNEDEVLELLKSFGFELVYTETLSFREQRQLMQETKILISTHGAGLTNLMFLPDDAKVIEIHPDTKRYNSCFYHLAAAIPINYHYLFADASDEDPQKADMTIDCGKLSAIINNCLHKQ